MLKLPVLALVSLAAAQYNNGTVVTITSDIVVTEFTTYCPEATTIVTNNKTITVTGPTTLTITNCPCTIQTTTTSSIESSVGPTSETTTFPSTEATTAPESTAVTINTEENIGVQYGIQGAAIAAAVFAALI